MEKKNINKKFSILIKIIKKNYYLINKIYKKIFIKKNFNR